MEGINMNEWMKPRTIFALMFYFLFVMLIACGHRVPEILLGMVNLLMGFYFGQKTKGGGA